MAPAKSLRPPPPPHPPSPSYLLTIRLFNMHECTFNNRSWHCLYVLEKRRVLLATTRYYIVIFAYSLICLSFSFKLKNLYFYLTDIPISSLINAFRNYE